MKQAGCLTLTLLLIYTLAFAQEIEPTTAATYEELLNTRRVQFDPQVNVGPAVIKTGQFSNFGDNPTLWLNVRVVSLPNLLWSSANSSVKVIVDHIWSKTDEDLLSESFSGAVFENISLQKGFGDDIDYYEGQRSVGLKAGTKREDIKSIEGILIFKLPVKTNTFELTTADLGPAKDVADGVQMWLRSLQDKTLSIEFTGNTDAITSGIFAYGAEGKLLDRRMSQRMNNTFTMEYDEPIQSVKVVVGEEFFEKSYPFTLK